MHIHQIPKSKHEFVKNHPGRHRTTRDRYQYKYRYLGTGSVFASTFAASRGPIQHKPNARPATISVFLPKSKRCTHLVSLPFYFDPEMNFSGYLREEEEYPVSGTDWGISACIDNACLGGGEPVVLDFPAGDAGRSNSRRIDMAAVINEHAAPFYEFECVKEGKDIEATDGDNGTLMTREEWSANGSYDLKSEESSTEERAFLFWPCVCSPCKSRILFVAFALFALFITGLGVGLALRDKPSNHSSVSASIGASGPQDSSGSSSVPDPASQTPGGSSETPESTLEPTSFDFEWDDYVIDWEEEEQNWDTTGDTVETESSNNSPFLVGAYYYPW